MDANEVENIVSKNTPGIAAVIDSPLSIETLIGFREKGVTLLEVRVDLFTEPFGTVREYIKSIKSAVGLPIIGTIRETKNNRDSRLDQFEKIMPFVDAVDIELDAAINRDVIFRAAGKSIIVSEHDFEKTPSVDGLEDIVVRAKEFGADIIKIAVMARNKKDVTRLLAFTETRPEKLVTISMGEIGALSRIAAPLFGSLFTYGFVTEAVAPGQVSLDTIIEELKLFYPGF